jgi:hypothetical protein
MPVARIISSSFEDALRFADYLRPLFDTVEIAQPGRISETEVDLEVNLELCTPQEAWQQITELSRVPESEIYVAPGALFPEGEQLDMGMSPDLPLLAGPAPAQEFESASQEVEAAITQASAAAVAATGSNGSGTHKEYYGTVEEEQLNWLGRARESLRQWLAVRALLREIRQMQERELAQEQQRQRQMELQFQRERREQEARQRAAALAPVAQLEVAAIQETEHLEKQPEAAQGPILQRQVAEEEERRQAEQEEAVRRGRFVEEILRRRAQEQAAAAIQAAKAPDFEAAPAMQANGTLDAETAPVEFQAVPAESFASNAETAPMVRFIPRPRSPRLQPAMALAGITSVLLTAVLMGYAHRRPASPVPLAVLQRSNMVRQKVPFGAAVVSAAVPEAAPEVRTPSEAAPESTPALETHGFQRDFHRVPVDRHEVDYVANDVTVRHFIYGARSTGLIHPASAVPVRASNRGIKQISDMD